MPSSKQEGYKYDVYFSYVRNSARHRWILKVKKILQNSLDLELGGGAEIFFDENLKPGEVWSESLGNALRASRCLVPLWSPDYFNSGWCRTEWISFLNRGVNLGDVGRVIAPVQYHDGDSFPQEAKAIQMLDVRKYTSNMPGFWKTRKAVKLEAKLRKFAVAVAEKIRTAPKFDNFPIYVEKDIERKPFHLPGFHRERDDDDGDDK
jgi:hypothetical protein